MSDKKPHHHGNLREALIDAGIALIDEGGLHALSLRKCAAIAGVSHAAPAHHFGGLDGLIGAMGTRGFLSFTEYMTSARSTVGNDPAERLRAILRGYLDFANEHPALFTLMFGSRIEIEVDHDLAVAADGAYQVLAETCAPFIAKDDTTPRATEILVWSLVHGYASLRLHGQVAPQGPVEDVLFDDITKRLPKLADALAGNSHIE